jgi:hypothetical protein
MGGRRGGSGGKKRNETKLERQFDWEEKSLRERKHGNKKKRWWEGKDYIDMDELR